MGVGVDGDLMGVALNRAEQEVNHVVGHVRALLLPMVGLSVLGLEQVARIVTHITVQVSHL